MWPGLKVVPAMSAGASDGFYTSAVGLPTYVVGGIAIDKDNILILKKIKFRVNSAEILPESNEILDAVATTVIHHPEFTLIEVAGHADERATDEYNLRLTQDRVNSVMAALIARTAQRLGHSCRPMTSGAGHDAQMMARMCPTAMIFVPSVKGISHNPAEHTEPVHLAAGADVLLHALLELTA